MRKLDRYVWREMLPPFIVAVLIVVVMFQVNFYMALGKNDLTRNVPGQAILKIIFLETPGFLSQTLPISVSLATAIAVSRIARESELTALRGAGCRVMRFLLPVAMFGVAVGAINYLIVDQIAPRASKASYELKTNVNMLASVGEFITNVNLRLQNYTANIGSITKEKGDEENLQLRGVVLFERPESNEVNITVADKGTYRRGVWTFNDAVIYRTKMDGKGFDMVMSKTIRINQKVAIRDISMPGGAAEMGIKELKEKIKELKALGQYTRNYEIEYHVKYSAPAMCIIFALISPIFSIKFAKHGGFMGVLVSMVVVLLYFNAWVISTQMIGKNPNVDPAIAAWLPNVLFLIAGFFGLRRLE
ncbi:MAG TPA: LptF/LptG family permease [Fimbriimonas sp.]|nr:LptF/LptG family permease [Fimbriimonas sp.]